MMVDSQAKTPVAIRQFPYPYRAALAICSDIDETRDTGEFLEIQRFLNTKQVTSMGPGVGLEIGNSFYFYDDDGHFSYFTGDARAQGVIRDLVAAGYIDCLHSFGDAARTHAQMTRGIQALDRFDGKLEVWVNHFNAPTDLGKKFEYMFRKCEGDDLRSDLYHADWMLDYGIRYAWVGAITRVIGQSLVRRASFLATVFDRHHPLRSGTSVLMEWRKSALGLTGDARYRLSRSNQLTGVLELADGHKLHEFIRYAGHPRGVSYAATSAGLAYTISQRVLDRLKAVQGFMIVYAHLGKNKTSPQVITPETQTALRHLEQEYRDGNILVTTTARLLNYYRTTQDLVWSAYERQGQLEIEIKHLDDPVFGRRVPTARELQGITFVVPHDRAVSIRLNGKELALRRNPVDASGRASVTIPFTPLVFPSEILAPRQIVHAA